ncbi:MAG: hypothetical protein EVA89_28615 [Sandaracinaceae bacterium]|nr:MAG: hypothetical protein EVA89_28615 [Sandaracinaceae bacterium]
MSWHPQQQGGGWGAPPAGPPAPFGQPPGQAPGSPPGPPPPGQGVDRSVVILVLGFSSLMALFIGCSFCGPVGLISLFLSVPAIVMARRDLRAIQAGQLPAHGRDATVVGLVVSIVSTVLSVLMGIVMAGLMILYGGLFGAAILMNQ